MELALKNISKDVQNLFLLALAEPSFLEAEKIKITLPTDEAQWKLWLELARHNGVQPFLAINLKRLGLDKSALVSPTILAELEDTRNKTLARNLKRWKGAGPLLDKFDQLQIPWMILKGNALADEVYGDSGYKKMNDLDLLVKRADIPRVVAVFKEEGLLTAAPAPIKDFEKLARFSHHLQPYGGRDLSYMVGIHWNLVNPLRGPKILEENLWARKISTTAGGRSVTRLGDADFLNHLCLHLSTYKAGIREIGDIVNAVRAFSKNREFKQKFLEVVQETGSQEDVFRSLSLAQIVSMSEGESFYSEVLKAIVPKVSAKLKRRMAARRRNPQGPAFTRTTHVGRIEKAYAFFSMTDSPLEKGRWLAVMWKNWLFAPSSEAYRLDFKIPQKNIVATAVCRLKAPYRVAEAFAHDLGWNIFFFSIAKHHWDLAKSLTHRSKPSSEDSENQKATGRAIRDAIAELE